ncbi:MAG: tetratricopeptide repeat protein [Flavisolibacter sp.]
MSETLEYIDQYFNGLLTDPEKTAFEEKCESDPTFANDVAFYIQLRSGLKGELYEQKKKQFHEQYLSLSSNQNRRSQAPVRKLFPYIAAALAACIIFFIAWQFFFKTTSSEAIADQYINDNFQQLSIQMGNTRDSLDKGVAAYNSKNYREAESIFASLAPYNAEAMKYLGLVYLITEDYNKAINQFQTLAKNTELYANPGLFYQAVSLMKRNAEGDKANAKKLLEEIIQKDLPGKKESEEWIKKL